MHKEFLVFSLALLAFFSLCVGNETDESTETTTTTMEEIPSTTAAAVETTVPVSVTKTTTTFIEINPLDGVPLSDIQIAACEAADEGMTCKTKLPDLGLVKAADCCEYLDKCC